MKERATDQLTIAPATVSDRSCAAVLGLEPRTFRELLADRKIPHARLGRRIVARVDDVLEALGAMSSARPVALELDADELGDDEPSAAPTITVDSVLRRAGLQRRVSAR